jgi:hypothetical protein
MRCKTTLLNLKLLAFKTTQASTIGPIYVARLKMTPSKNLWLSFRHIPNNIRVSLSSKQEQKTWSNGRRHDGLPRKNSQSILAKIKGAPSTSSILFWACPSLCLYQFTRFCYDNLINGENVKRICFPGICWYSLLLSLVVKSTYKYKIWTLRNFTKAVSSTELLYN